MLEADMSQHLTINSLPSGLPHFTNVNTRGPTSTSHITYNRFLQGYWPHLPQNLRKGLGYFHIFDPPFACWHVICRSCSCVQWIDGSVIDAVVILLYLWVAILGVIQGSEGALSQESRFLDKKSYESLSHRAQHTFASHRNTIYAIFLSYLKQKSTSKEHDAADRFVSDILPWNYVQVEQKI